MAFIFLGIFKHIEIFLRLDMWNENNPQRAAELPGNELVIIYKKNAGKLLLMLFNVLHWR